MHRFSSRSAESAGLTRRAIEPPSSVLYGTLRRPTERNPVRTNDFGDAVENLCIIRANTYRTVLACLQVQEKKELTLLFRVSCLVLQYPPVDCLSVL